MSFVHLHTHSHYSIGRAVASVRDLVERAARLRMPALALTDNNSIAGLHDLTRAADEFGVQPIIGCEINMLPSNQGFYQGRVHPLVFLVENEPGYRNLVRLLTRAYEKANDQPPHVSFTDYERHSEGLIALTGSRRSELYHLLREKNSAQTKEYLNRLAVAAGHENIFFEIIEYPHPRTRRIMDQVLELSQFLHLPAVATQNVHFLDPEDMPAYCAMVQHPRLLAPYWPLEKAELPTRHFATPQEMKKRFGFTPDLLDRTLEIAARCTFRFPRRRAQLPVPDFQRGQDAPSLLWECAIRGAAARYGDINDEALRERLNEEYGDICSDDNRRIDLCGYLLVLRDIALSLKEESLCRGVGRGSLLTSVIAYALNITEIDPLAYDLPYEPLRPGPRNYPLFELEVSGQAMGRAVEILREKYGEQNVVAVGKRKDWGRQNLFHHLSRWAGLPPRSLRPYASVQHKQEPFVDDEPGDEDSYSPAARPPTPRAEWDEDVEVAHEAPTGHFAWIDDPRIPLDETLRNYETLARATFALHPCPREFEADRAHYVLGKDPVNTVVPVLTAASGEKTAQAEALFLDRLELPRVRFASFGLLSILETAQEWIRHEGDSKFSFFNIPLNDESAFRLLRLGLTNGIAPLHSITAKSLLRSEAPRDMADLLEVHTKANHRHPAGGDGAQEPLHFREARAETVKSLPDCILGYWCAYLKARYPVAFMASLLTHAIPSRGSTAPRRRPRFEILLRETRRMEIEVLGPHINFSDYAFTREQNRIRTGLMAIHGMGERTYEEIDAQRQGQPFSSLADFCARARTQRSVVVNLIKAGAFDEMDPNRAQLLVEFESILKRARPQEGRSPLAAKEGGEEQLQLFETWDFREKESEKRRAAPSETSRPEPGPRDIMRYEREAVGYCFSYDLLDYYDELMQIMGAVSPFQLVDCEEGATVYVAGFIDHAESDGNLIDEGTALVLDLEGYVIKAPASVAEAAMRLQTSRGPVLIEGVVERRGKSELLLVASQLDELEEVARWAQVVAELRLNLAGQDKKRLARIAAILKSYRGKARVVVEGEETLGWRGSRGISKMKIFFCPPLYDRLRAILPETRIQVLDKNGQEVEV